MHANLFTTKSAKVFISVACDNNEYIKYVDGNKLSNLVFRRLSEKTRQSSVAQDKIELIRNNIKSLEDLADMLDAECLFEEGYVMYFKSLSQMETALLLKYASDLGLENGYEKEWYFEFNKYILSLNKQEQKSIQNLKEKIQLI